MFSFVLIQLAGTGVLAVGLWLRFDSRTAGLFEGEDSPTVFFTGKAFDTQGTKHQQHPMTRIARHLLFTD